LKESHKRIVILDFGSQYTKLIARRVRELSVFSQILPHDTPTDTLNHPDVLGIILSGSPHSVLDEDAPQVHPDFWNLEKPVLGICYGQQLMCHQLGGSVEPSDNRQFGPAVLELEETDHPLFVNIDDGSRLWMSHGDRLLKEPPGFQVIAHSPNAPITAMVHDEHPWFGIQFHPEVSHTEQGKTLLANFLYDICGAKPEWRMSEYIDEAIEAIRETVGDHHVLLGLSGGVDSSVAALLIHKAIGDNLTCVFVDHGMLRHREAEQVKTTFSEHFGIHLVAVDASETFLSKLEGVSEPEIKRKIIGNTFVEVFESEAAKLPKPKFLAQGTLYPDVIESASHGGPAQTIKTHHNVGGLPEKMQMELLEPLRELFKDEVREVGRLLGLPDVIVKRHPFPGPGLAVRILGDINREAIRMLQLADDIFIQSLHRHQLYDSVSQAFAVLLPVKTVGIMGDERTYERVCALRSVSTDDFMTADWSRLPYQVLAEISSRIVNEVAGINRVVLDITSKPPGTIEWE